MQKQAVTGLPRTSRINEKIMEYYSKYGKERDLEKFMRLYSPAESHSHSTTTTSDEDECGLRRLFVQEAAAGSRENLISSVVSSSLWPEINIKSTSSSNDAQEEHLIPIRIEEENGGKPKAAKSTNTNMQTPQKNLEESNSKQTQTPDSIVKSHKRLEWDSLGDVGYKKSMSTSNISILERSLLREFFQEKSSTSSQKINTNSSEGDLKKLQFELQEEEYKFTTKKLVEPQKYNTPPLASSTFVDAGARPKTNTRNMSAKSTSTSLQKKFEKYAQTSVQRSTVNSQEVQVNMSSTTSSNIGSSATPSSFDYFSSRSSHRSAATTTTSNDEVKSSHRKKKSRKEQKEHPFVAGINEMLAQRKAFVENISCKQKHEDVKEQLVEGHTDSLSLHQLHDTLKKVLSENKENSAASSTIIRSPQLDLGIQLLCSLIDAKSLTQKQKRKLVRDIVKRISQMDVDVYEDFDASTLPHAPSTSLSNVVVSSPIATTQVSQMKKSSSSVSGDSLNMQELGRSLPSGLHSWDAGNLTSSAKGEHVVRVESYKKTSPPTTSAKALSKITLEIASVRKITNEAESKPPRINTNANNENVPKVAPSKNTTNETIETKKATHLQNEHNVAPTEKISQKHSTSPSSSSKEVITTLKVVNENSNSTDGTDNQSATMREWLNPMTQSEIDYEEKKREFARNAAKREKILNKAQNTESETERSVQLNWIETEIQRLESLRHLILKEEDSTSATATDLEETQPQTRQQKQAVLSTGTQQQKHAVLGTGTQKQITTPGPPPRAQIADKLYDTVFSSEKSSGSSALSGSAEKLVQEIEVIIEESNEDIVNLNDNLKRSKLRKRETQTHYDKPRIQQRNYDGSIGQGNARFRTVTETITTNEEQVLSNKGNNKIPIPPPAPSSLAASETIQRSKIDTPSGGSNDSESVCSFVQHRKREFMEQYKNKKKIHYETLLQQQQHQQQLLLKQQREILYQLQRRPRMDMSTTADGVSTAAANQQLLSGHYSVPHTMERTYPPIHHHYNPQYMQHHHHHHPYHNHYIHNPHTPQKATHSLFSSTNYPPPPPPPPVEHTTSACLTSTTSAPPFEQQNPNSSSSVFCISSEVSVPMGNSNDTSSTPTTTHQYDDVAAGTAGVGVQTSDSLRRSHPIFKPPPPPAPPTNHVSYHTCNPTIPHWCAPQFPLSGQSACIQVKPKAIAYVINFGSKLTISDENSLDIGAPTAATTEEQPQLTLQDHLQRARPKFLAQSKERKAILNQIQALRQEREREMRDIVDNTSINSLDKKLKRLPPPPTKRIRIFPTKEMKAMTNKRCEKLPEVVEKQLRDREERRRRSNRILRDVFNRRLQKRVRNGKLSLNHSRTVI